MKKIFAIIMTLCLITSALCITAFANAPASDVVISVSALKKDNIPAEIENADYKDFAEGWEAAIDYASNHEYMDINSYERIVIDFFADWNANSSGEFGDSDLDGFKYSTIYVPSDTKIVINLNGHTINRGLTKYEYDGEVICINDDADVIINGGKSGDPIIEPSKDPGDVKTGKITGGFSCNGAGGIHMQDGSKLTLNNVNIVGNRVEDDDGAGIALYDGATLTMNGGSLSDNTCFNWVDNKNGGCGIYVNDSEVVFNHTVIQNNQFKDYYCGKGAAINAVDSDVTMNNCKVIGNGKYNKKDGLVGADAVIYGNGGSFNITSTVFESNGCPIRSGARYSSLIYSKSDLTIDKCDFTANNIAYLIDSEGEHLKVLETHFKDNDANVFYGHGISNVITFTDCSFNNNVSSTKQDDIYTFNFTGNGTAFLECDMGNSTLNNEKYARFATTALIPGLPHDTVGQRVGTIFGEGSLPMLVALLALAASAVSIYLSVFLNKKKVLPTGITNSEEDEEK